MNVILILVQMEVLVKTAKICSPARVYLGSKGQHARQVGYLYLAYNYTWIRVYLCMLIIE